ncbi:unnamed protein product [Oikopleura dioica]|uniref:Aminopeptidase N-like N-terminal domain-containing protein n=1 Tax=Oikopleura dioica TaxID=34765 RepID=E4XN76_OIKDI|nr:unnamed protein product [Oikopleura dioica]
MRSVLALLGLAAACSKDSGSLFGWTVDELEVEVDSLKKRADSSDAEIVALKATVASLQQRIEGVEGDLTCSARIQPKVTRVIVTVGGVDVPVTYNLNPDYYYLTIYADHKIVSGSEVKAMVHYENEVPTGTKGLYLSHYTNPDGVKRYLLTTQFESTGARMAFPCFDEPDLKAIFNFEISYRYSEYTAIFNMDPIGPPNQVGDRYTVKYQPTMKISTYILAMLISDFNTDSSGVSADGVKVRILGRKEWENETNWALEETLSVVDGLSEKFGYKYCNAFPEPSAFIVTFSIPSTSVFSITVFQKMSRILKSFNFFLPRQSAKKSRSQVQKL